MELSFSAPETHSGRCARLEECDRRDIFSTFPAASHKQTASVEGNAACFSAWSCARPECQALWEWPGRVRLSEWEQRVSPRQVTSPSVHIRTIPLPVHQYLWSAIFHLSLFFFSLSIPILSPPSPLLAPRCSIIPHRLSFLSKPFSHPLLRLVFFPWVSEWREGNRSFEFLMRRMKNVALVISWRYELVNFSFAGHNIRSHGMMWDNKRGRLCVRWWEGSSMISDWLRWRETGGEVRGLWSLIDHFGLTDGRYFMPCQTRRKTEMEADGVRVMESGLMLTREDEVPQQCNNLLFPHPDLSPGGFAGL